MNAAFNSLRILVDNTAADGLKAQHGFSVLISADGQTFLFDTGQRDALKTNVSLLGISLKHIDGFILSHGHYDHTGAVDFVLQENPEVPVYAHPKIFSERYSIYPGSEAKEISMPPEERLLIANLPDSRLHWVRGATQIMPGVWLSGPIPRVQLLEDTGGPFFTDSAGRCTDPIEDDMAMWIETAKGLLVLCGCCHSGLVNTLDHIFATSGHKRIWGIVGGLHLKEASEARLQMTAKTLEEVNPGFLLPCHCTGENAIEFFKRNLSAEIIAGYAGYELRMEKEV